MRKTQDEAVQKSQVTLQKQHNKRDKLYKLAAEAQMSQRDRATRYVSLNLVNCCTDVQKITLEQS